MELRQSKHWDHRWSLLLLVSEHPHCLYEADFQPHEVDMECGVVACGAIYLPQNNGFFTALCMAQDGWIYFADSSIGDEVLTCGTFVPMRTEEAVEVVESRAKALQGGDHA